MYYAFFFFICIYWFDFFFSPFLFFSGVVWFRSFWRGENRGTQNQYLKYLLFSLFFFCCVGMLFLGLLGVITHSAGSVWFSIQFWLSKRQGCLVFPFTPFTIYENDYYSLIHSIPPQKQLDTENTWMFLYFLRKKKNKSILLPCIGYLKNRKLFIDLCCRRIIFY